MSRIYEALKKAEELRAAAQGYQLQPTTNFADTMPNLKIAPPFYGEYATASATPTANEI
jgi:hypothetical protein